MKLAIAIASHFSYCRILAIFSPYYRVMARSTTQRDSLSTKDHFDVCESLKILKDKELVKLGTALGLLYSNLDRMKNLPDDLVDAWLKEMDNVEEKSGSPSWTSLISALESIGQGGVASTIKKGILLSTFLYQRQICFYGIMNSIFGIASENTRL